MNKIIFFIAFLIFFSNQISALCSSNQININTASLSELDKLDGIGPVKAQAIIDTRPFSSLDDLLNVKGIGDVTLQKIKSQGLACVDAEQTEEETPEKIQAPQIQEETTPEKEKISDESNQKREEIPQTFSQTELTSESIINLNQNINTESKNIYESRSEQIKKYSLYAFALFILIFVFVLIGKK